MAAAENLVLLTVSFEVDSADGLPSRTVSIAVPPDEHQLLVLVRLVKAVAASFARRPTEVDRITVPAENGARIEWCTLAYLLLTKPRLLVQWWHQPAAALPTSK